MTFDQQSDGFVDAVKAALDGPDFPGSKRRQLIKLLASAGMLSLVPGRASWADDKKIVVCNWGGDMLRAQPVAWGKPFQKATGTRVDYDGTGPSFGKIRTMVESKHVVWDVCDANLAVAYTLGTKGFLEPIDYSIVDRNKVRPGFATEFGVSNFIYSFVLAYDKSKFGDHPPKTWADFWNVKDFPGMRSLSARTLGTLEGALMADGVPADASKIYPIDEKRAFAKIAELKPHTIYWHTSSESQQLLRQGQVSMAMIYSTRAVPLRKEPGSTFDFTWNQGIVIPAGWVVPKGNPAGKEAFKFLAFTQKPETQLEMLRLVGAGPANPATNAIVPPELQRNNPASEENFRQQIMADPIWVGKNQDRIYNDYIKVISG